MTSLQQRLAKVVEFKEYAGRRNDYVDGRIFESERLKALHAVIGEVSFSAQEVLSDQLKISGDIDGSSPQHESLRMLRDALAKLELEIAKMEGE